MIEQLILVRHGETVHNVAKIAQGWNDSALSELGERQVRALAERLRSFSPDALISSPLGRAFSTAQAIATATGLPVSTNDDLREMNYGAWEGRSFLDVRRDFADAYHAWIEDENAPCPEGESHIDVRRRLERAFGSIEARRPVIVTHGTAIRVAATVLLNLPVLAARQFAQDNAAINIFMWRADRFVLKCWNDASHCEQS